MAKAKPNGSSRVALTSGPPLGVFSSRQPFDNPGSQKLQDAGNGYFPDAVGGSGFWARAGFQRAFGGRSLWATGRGQGIYSHPLLDGSTVSYLVGNGRIYQVDPALTVATDVTPSGVTIDNGPTTRVSFLSLIGNLAVNDSVNPPWTVLEASTASVPMAGAYIDYDGTGTGTWQALQGTLYGNAPFYPLVQVNNVARDSDISWGNPGFFTVGWQQADFDNNWTLETASAGKIYAICGTNQGFYYFRRNSIGIATGSVNIDLRSTATEDSIGFNIGTQAAQSVQQFGDSIYFCDAVGRPYRLVIGTTQPIPIWKQMQSFVEGASVASPATTAVNITSAIEPNYNLYLVGIWSTATSTNVPPAEFFAFDALTGTYVGRWSIDDDGTGGIHVECLGIITDSSGRSQLVAIEKGGFVWTMNVLTSTFDLLTTEANTNTVITTESNTTVGTPIITEYLPATWTDDGHVPNIFVTTDRMGYGEDVYLNVTDCTIITLSDSPVTVTATTTLRNNVVQGTPTPSPSFDGTYRLFAGLQLQGRGVAVTVAPTQATSQWAFQRITARASVSQASPRDP